MREITKLIRVNMKLSSVIGFALITGVALSACQAHTSASSAPTAASGAPVAATGVAATDANSKGDPLAAAELREHHRHHHLGGVTQFIAMSLDTLGGDDAKRAQIEKIQSSLYACMAPAGEVQNKVLLTLADGVAAGAVDTAKVNATIAQLKSTSNVHECSIDSLNQLHALLSPAERTALVDKVNAHWEVWQQANHDVDGRAQELHGQVDKLTQELGLTPDQVEKISAALRTALAGLASKFDPKQAEAHRQGFAQAFVGESFDAKSITAIANNHISTHGSARMALFYETLAPLLTPAQRTTLAEHLREHASHQPSAISKK